MEMTNDEHLNENEHEHEHEHDYGWHGNGMENEESYTHVVAFSIAVFAY
jgi:hypothetical protein